MGRKLTDEEKAARAQARARLATERAAQRALLREQRAQQKIADKIAAVEQRVADAEGGRLELPALVFRNGGVVPCTLAEAGLKAVIPALDHLCLDVETSGYPLGHALYELRTIQLGGEHAAVVLDAGDEAQRRFAAKALGLASRLHAHSAVADIVPVVHAGLIAWDDAWGKMRDSVLLAKLADPKSTGSEADGLKDLAHDILGDYATSPGAEKEKNALFKAMGCKARTDLATSPGKNGWLQVSRNAVTMIRYAGSDVLDLAAVIPRLTRPLNISEEAWEELLERETRFQAACALVAWQGFALDKNHIVKMISAHEYFQASSLHEVQSLSSGVIVNPSSPDTGARLLGLFPGLVLERSMKTGEPSAARASLERPAAEGNELCKAILDYRHHVTTLGLLLRPLEALCDYGDGRMRPTVYTINADTGRTSCVRPNGQQFSRRGQVRKCVVADEGMLGIACDFEGCEIRVASALSGDVGLYEAELSPKCHACGGNPCACGKEHKGLHWLAAHMVWGDGATKENRYVAKRIIFSKLFGGSPAAGARQTGITEALSGLVHRAFEEIAPGYAQWDQFLRQCYYQGTRVWKDPQTWELRTERLGSGRRGIWTAYTGRNIYINAPHAFSNYCVSPDTLILRHDMRHVPASEIQPGDELVGFDEWRQEGEKYRRLRKAVAEKVSRTRKPSVTVTAGGISTTCSADHLWWCRTRTEPHRGERFRWTKAADLRLGDELLSLGTWEEADSCTAGYLAGLYDGEGSLQARGLGHRATAMTFSQLPGIVMDAFVGGMAELGLGGTYRKRCAGSTTPTDSVQVTSIRNMMRVLGTLRPVRLLAKSAGFYEGAALTGGVAQSLVVESVADAGMLELVSIQTSTRTFIANGILSHNCIQGTARELLVDGLLRWRGTRWGAYPTLPVHDEVICFVPAGEAREAVAELQRCMATRLYHAEIGADPDEPFAFWPDSS